MLTKLLNTPFGVVAQRGIAFTLFFVAPLMLMTTIAFGGDYPSSWGEALIRGFTKAGKATNGKDYLNHTGYVDDADLWQRARTGHMGGPADICETAKVTVGTTAVKLETSSDLQDVMWRCIQNQDASTALFVVTASGDAKTEGVKVEPGQRYCESITADLWAISDSGSITAIKTNCGT